MGQIMQSWSEYWEWKASQPGVRDEHECIDLKCGHYDGDQCTLGGCYDPPEPSLCLGCEREDCEQDSRKDFLSIVKVCANRIPRESENESNSGEG